MNYGSVCSGIEAATAAWHPLGWKPAFFSEIESFPCAVLAHHYPHVPNRGDMTKFQEWPDAALDVLVGGTPCQSFSVAGLRKGLDDPRGNLMLTFGAIARRYRPEWLVWENVPGVLSSNGGRDFGTFLGMLGGLGYGFAYRVLDAQYFGLAQRRRRVFVVGCLGDWRRAAAVLFERHSLSGHPAPSRETGERPAPTISARTSGGGGLGTDFDCDGGVIRWPAEVATTLDAHYGDKMGLENQPNGGGQVAVAFTTEQTPKFSHDRALTLTKQSPTGGGQPQCVAFGWQNSSSQGDSANEHVTPTLDKSKTPAVAVDCYNGAIDGDVTATLRKGNGNENGGVPAAMQGMAVRRLTPGECETLQGFSRGYTAIPWRNKPANECPDGPRYKALGNSMAVPVMRWIGERIAQVAAIAKAEAAA